jgi:hypothetical protein
MSNSTIAAARTVIAMPLPDGHGVSVRRLVVTRPGAPPVSRDYPPSFSGQIGWFVSLPNENVIVELLELGKGTTPPIISKSEIVLGKLSSNGLLCVGAVSSHALSADDVHRIRTNQIGSPVALTPS